MDYTYRPHAAQLREFVANPRPGWAEYLASSAQKGLVIAATAVAITPSTNSVLRFGLAFGFYASAEAWSVARLKKNAKMKAQLADAALYAMRKEN